MTRSLLAAVAALLVFSAPADAARNCPAKPRTLAKNGIGRVWHEGHRLLACTTVYEHAPKTKRMGRWTRGTQVAFNGADLAWTVRSRRGGKVVDRAWAGSVDTRVRWLKGRKLVPATGDAPERDARIQRLLQADQSAGWVTRAGDVALVVRSPQGEPEAIGTLPTPLDPDGNRLRIGSFPNADAAALGAGARLRQLDGEGDACGGSNPYRLTVTPEPGGQRVGAVWTGDWTSTNTAAC